MTVKAYGAHGGDKPLVPLEISRRAVGAHDVQIDIAYCGVCHSDLHQVSGEWPGTQFPCVPGHEIVGRVAAVGGHVSAFKAGDLVGIGCIVTYCCDLIVASDKAEWRLPQVGLGILPAQGGTVRLARWIGRGQAMKVAMGFPLKADEAYRIGLAQWLVPHGELMAKAMEVAEHVAGLPPLAARLGKESVAFGMDSTLREAANADLYRFMTLELTEDKKEAHQAWRDRRKPAIKGR